MRWLLLILLATPAPADERAPLYGTWGTEAQCRGDLLIPDGTVRAAPFQIRPGWITQGGLWCRLSWFPVQTRPDGLFVGTRALCGEDSVRGYWLDMALDGEGLRLIWDEALVNGPLKRCAPPS